MHSHLRKLATLLLVMFLIGCGQSGALFVPGNPSTVQPPPASQDNSANDEEDPQESDDSGSH